MQKTNCPYIKISAAEAAKNSAQNSGKILAANTQNISAFSLVPTANAQAATVQTTDLATNLSQQLSVPFYFIVASFFLFVILMSAVYMYHWMKFNLNDPFIKNFTPIYFVGLVVLTIPLLFNLFF